MPREAGDIAIHLNVSVQANGREKSEWIKFRLQPVTKWNNDSIFLPTEIVKSVRGNPRQWNG
ncbi:MAG: hypothetical protein ACON4K_04160 [Akkermansiaceae bacterium]